MFVFYLKNGIDSIVTENETPLVQCDVENNKKNIGSTKIFHARFSS